MPKANAGLNGFRPSRIASRAHLADLFTLVSVVSTGPSPVNQRNRWHVGTCQGRNLGARPKAWRAPELRPFQTTVPISAVIQRLSLYGSASLVLSTSGT